MQTLWRNIPDPPQAGPNAQARPHQNHVVSVVQAHHAAHREILGGDVKTTILDPRCIRAAASLANGGYQMSVFQIRRDGNRARVSGTNGYASITATVPAEFSRWPDGKSLTFGGSNVRAMMRAITRSLKHADKVDFSFANDTVKVALKADAASVETCFSVTDDKMFGKCESTDWESMGIKGPDGDTVNPHTLKLASYAIELLGLQASCRIEDELPYPYKLTVETPDVSACALVVRDRRKG